MTPEPITRPQRRVRAVRHVESPRRMEDRRFALEGWAAKLIERQKAAFGDRVLPDSQEVLNHTRSL